MGWGGWCGGECVWGAGERACVCAVCARLCVRAAKAQHRAPQWAVRAGPCLAPAIPAFHESGGKLQYGSGAVTMHSSG